MCGRFVIYSGNIFGLSNETSYNIAPSQLIPVKTKKGARLMKWSYSPIWKRDMGLINCRSETMHEKPSFRNAERCVIYHDGWYEWQRSTKGKIPYYHYTQSNLFAGLYNEIGCLILTRKSIDAIKHIHHRQPVLLDAEEVSLYLKGEDILDSAANNNIDFHRVCKSVNNPKNNNASLIHKLRI